MESDRDAANTADEYVVTAIQIFDYCGAESTGTLHVDALMDKFAPFMKTDKTELSFLKSLLDPEQSNPEINVTKLAFALNKYSENQKNKVDLDESFNLRNGPMPQDSDSGISTDGFQLVEELQCELREKAHLAQKLRSQLDFSDRQHEESLNAITAERDALKTRLNMLREENQSLNHVRRDYEDMCDRLCVSETTLTETRRELDSMKRRVNILEEQVYTLENEKLTLEELLTKSKEECHRINEMYANRQSSLIEENETLKTEHADLTSRLQDQEEYMQRMIKDKVLVEMELKDLLNKSNQTHLRLDRSIDVSYTDDQLLTALDTLNSDSRFSTDNQILDEESFVNALREDQGRSTNMSLFDEIRLSICNISRPIIESTPCDKCLDASFVTIGTQTDEGIENDNNNCRECTKCQKCDQLKKNSTKLESDVARLTSVVKDMQSKMAKYEYNLDVLQKIIDDDSNGNNLLQIEVERLQNKLATLENICRRQTAKIESLNLECLEMRCAQCQTEFDQASVSTQTEVPCAECVKRNAVVAHRSIRRYLWEPLKCLFQVFAIVCFVCAVTLLYGVTARTHGRCGREFAPWTWMNLQEIMDLFFRIEYVAEVPM